MIKLTRVCYGCKQSFRKEELIEYTSPKAAKGQWYCPRCLAEREAREAFANKVCEVFGIKTPGPRIWTDRKRLIEKYGYTDQTIIDCLDYIYNVKHFNKLTESLGLVTPQMINQMKQYKRHQSSNSGSIIAAISQPVNVQEVEVRENTQSNKQRINSDDWLNDD